MFINDSIRYVGVNDHQIDLFEGQYPVPDGVSYNSYVILDESCAVLDTVDRNFTQEWLHNIEDVLVNRAPDYLIVHHMEPDHSANIHAFLQKYPQTTVVATAKAFDFMKSYFGTDFSDRRIIAVDGQQLNLGKHTLTFYTAPMVHWPEVMVSYDAFDKVLFSADGFGKFGALDIEQPWDDEARRYYIGIVGKYGMQTNALLKKAAALDIQKICPLHGPVLSEDLGHYLSLYQTWASYQVEAKGTVIAYSSVYGHTRKAVEELAALLRTKGACVTVYDLARCDQSKAVADTFRYSQLVLATTTYNASIFPCMRTFIESLVEHNYQNRTVGLIENGTWAPQAAKLMTKMLEGAKNITFTQTTVSIKAAVADDNRKQLEALANELC